MIAGVAAEVRRDLDLGRGANSSVLAAYPSAGQHRPAFGKDRQMNTMTITGRLTRDPELKHVEGGRAICDMRIAVDNGRHPTTYIDVTAFDGHAYTCAEFLTKGRKVGVDGKLALSEWRDAGGQNHQRYRVIGRVEFLDRPRERGAAATEPPAPEPAESARPELALAA